MADRDWQDKAIGIVGRLGDKLSDLARRSTAPVTEYLEPRLKDVAKTSSDVAMQVYEDPELIFGQETGQPLLVDLASGMIPLGSMVEHAATGTDPGLIDALDAFPAGGTLASLGKAGFFALAKAERKELFSKLMQLFGHTPKERDAWFKVFQKMPESVQNSYLTQFGDVRHPQKLGGEVISPSHTPVLDQVQHRTAFSPDTKNIYIGPEYQNRMNVLLHEGGHGIDDVFNLMWSPRGPKPNGPFVERSSSGLVDEWYDKMPPPSKDLKDDEGYYSVDRLRDLMKKSKDLPDYNAAGFTHFDQTSPLRIPLKNGDYADEFKSAVQTLNQGLHNTFKGVNPIDTRFIEGDDLHNLAYYYNVEYPESMMATEGVAKAMELMPFREFQKTPVGTRLIELMEDNPAQYFDIDFTPFADDLKTVGKKKKK